MEKRNEWSIKCIQRDGISYVKLNDYLELRTKCKKPIKDKLMVQNGIDVRYDSDDELIHFTIKETEPNAPIFLIISLVFNLFFILKLLLTIK